VAVTDLTAHRVGAVGLSVLRVQNLSKSYVTET
jgi:hypothetical protein